MPKKSGLILNILIRIALIYFLIEVMMLPHDARFEGKAIPVRNLVVVGSLSLLFPILWWWKSRKEKIKYPFFADNIYLSIFLVDMAGNSFNFYDGIRHFDLLAHFHGTGAFAAVCFLILTAKKIEFKKAFLFTLLIATSIHAALELQEYLTDVYFGTHNVNGWSDTIGDLTAGFFGVAAYVIAAYRFAGKADEESLKRMFYCKDIEKEKFTRKIRKAEKQKSIRVKDFAKRHISEH